jgi:hypothetical protein
MSPYRGGGEGSFTAVGPLLVGPRSRDSRFLGRPPQHSLTQGWRCRWHPAGLVQWVHLDSEGGLGSSDGA